jgi:hypothetical protein
MSQNIIFKQLKFITLSIPEMGKKIILLTINRMRFFQKKNWFNPNQVIFF